jgi:hypothetical protein
MFRAADAIAVLHGRAFTPLPQALAGAWPSLALLPADFPLN